MSNQPDSATARVGKSNTAVDLFAGAGGATLGLIDAGLTVLAAIESDPVAAKSYAANHGDVRLYREDIRRIEPIQLMKDLAIKPDTLTLLKACPPCQSFSTLGSGDKHDERNDLVLEVWRFLTKLRPKGFLLENVPGLQHDERLATFVRRARAIGYGVPGPEHVCRHSHHRPRQGRISGTGFLVRNLLAALPGPRHVRDE